MADTLSESTEVLATVPPHQRGLIISGMRWTAWLSLLGAPFGYGTTVVLARLGPDVLGTYGLLLVYIGIVSSLLYFGGDPVTIRFVPSLKPEQRFSFLASYFIVICATLIPFLAIITFRPHLLYYVFGKTIEPSFGLTVLYCAPIYIATMLVIAGLKAVLEMRWAQLLSRALTIGTFVVYLLLYCYCLPVFKEHYKAAIWGIYLGLTGCTFLAGLMRLAQIEEWRSPWRSVRFFLPRGFWTYTVSTQQGSVVGFFLQRMDMILVLHFGGLALLGQYVAVLTVAGLVQVVSRFFLDTLQPALTNMIAIREFSAASDIFATNLRIFFAISMFTASGVIFLVGPLTGLLGTHYRGDRILFIIMTALAGLAAPGGAGGTLLVSLGKPQRVVWVGVAQLTLFVVLFFALWPTFHLLGAVIANGGATVVCSLLLLASAKRAAVVPVRIFQTYACFALVITLCATVAIASNPFGTITGLSATGSALVSFLLVSGYSQGELRGLMACFLPQAYTLRVRGRHS